MSLSEPVGPHSTSQEPTELKVSPAVAGCAHLVIVLVDILVEFVQSYSSTKVGRAVLGRGQMKVRETKRLLWGRGSGPRGGGGQRHGPEKAQPCSGHRAQGKAQ